MSGRNRRSATETGYGLSRQRGVALLAAAAALLLLPPALAAYPTVTFVDGRVEVVREHRSLRPDLLFGAQLEPFDFVATGADGVSQLRMGEAAAAVRLRLDPDSAIMLHPFAGAGDATSAPEPSTARRLIVELLHGSLAVQAAEGRGVTILLREGRVGAAGADVVVARGPAGALRVEARAGRATVHIDDARPPRLFAGPERGVVYSPQPPAFENTEPAGDLGAWRSARLAGAAMEIPAAGDAPRAQEAVAPTAFSAYPAARADFDRAYRALIDAEPAILEWMRDADVRRGLSDAVADEIEAPLAALEEARRELEPLFHGLLVLAPLAGEATLPDEISRDARIITERLHTARHLLRLFFEHRRRMPGAEVESPIPARGM